MGKGRIKTIGVEEEENKQKKQAAKRAEKKREEKIEAASQANSVDPEAESQKNPSAEETTESDAPKEKVAKQKKPSKYKTKKAQKHSASYLAIAKLIDKNKKYSTLEALSILLTTKTAKFDETIELHINTNEKGVSGRVILPHGVGKEIKVEIADVTVDPKHVEDLIKKISNGQIDFDILIASPDTMPKLASVARFLGPRGLMPNPKNGTISTKPKEALKQFEGGQIHFKTEPKFPIIHMSVGKVSFGEKKLAENIKELIQSIKSKNIKSITLKSTMSPGIKISI